MNAPVTPTGPTQPGEPTGPIDPAAVAYPPGRALDPAPEARKITTAQRTLVVVIIAYTVGAVLYQFLIHNELGHTAAMFIGIPALLSILLALAPRPKSAKGSILRGIAIAMLLVAPLLGEGYLCILMAAPLFLGIGLVVGASIDSSRARRGTTLSCVALVLLPMSLEGIVPWLTHDRAQTVEVTRTIAAPAGAVEQALTHSPQIATALPGFLRIGFPRPLEAHGDGLTTGSLRTIHFAGAEGDPPGDLIMRVTESSASHVRFETISDSSKLTQWLCWQSSDVTWTPVDATHTTVTWRISFDRQLDPYWYFAPWERFAVHQAAGYLITANATPHE